MFEVPVVPPVVWAFLLLCTWVIVVVSVLNFSPNSKAFTVEQIDTLSTKLVFVLYAAHDPQTATALAAKELGVQPV